MRTALDELIQVTDQILDGDLQKEEALPTLTEDGRRADGKAINPGDVFRTATDRETTPYPKYSRKRTTRPEEARLNQWLIDNYLAEAEARNDDFNATIAKGLDAKNFSVADGEGANLYIFGKPQGLSAEAAPQKEEVKQENDNSDIDRGRSTKLNVGDTFTLSGVDYELDDVSSGRVSAFDVDSGAMLEWDSYADFENETGKAINFDDRHAMILGWEARNQPNNQRRNLISKKTLSTTSTDDIMAMFDGTYSEEANAEEEKAKAAGAKALANAAKYGVRGIDEITKGLVDLFGGSGSVNMFFGGLNRETYDKAKVHFEAGFASFKEAGKSLKEFAAWVRDSFGAGARGYFQAWVMERKGEEIVFEDDKANTPKTLLEALQANADKITNNTKLKAYVAEFNGIKTGEVTAEQMKAAQEAFELIQVVRARQVVGQGMDQRETFEKLLELYQSQPNLDVRSSTSMENQAYSTPAPIAYLASQLAGIESTTRVYEPTAGNGMLLIGTKNTESVANELDPQRLERLKSLPFKTSNHDATNWKPQELFPSVIMNPPFGKLRDDDGTLAPVKVDGFKVGSIDHLIAARGA